jgi:hypothetical protein
MIRTALLVILLALAVVCVMGQSNFNVFLRLNFDSAVESIGLYEGISGNPQNIAELRGSQIAMATTALLAQRNLSTSDLTASLQAAKFNNIVGDDVFRMKEARSHVASIKALVDQCKRHNFGQKVVSTVEQLFPEDTRLSTTMPVYFVAFGHNNIDAYVRRVVWSGNTPIFVGEGQGELTVVVNLAKAATYGGPVEQQFIELLTVVAHEVFHVAFGMYQDSSPNWRRHFAQHRGYIDDLLELTQNEGIAYYLNLIQHSQGRLSQAWVDQLPGSFAQFNSSVHELLSPHTSPRRAEELIRSSNLSGSHKESFGSFIGMIVARQIDQTYGRDALRQTIALGPFDFFGKYIDASRRDNNLPAFSEEFVRYVSANR